MTLHLSYRTRRHLAENVTALPLGEAHYSYTQVYDKFAATLTAAEAPFRELPMPEIYPGHLVPTLFPPDRNRVVHIAFKPFDELRLLKGAYNIAHVAWEHEKLPTFEGRAAEDLRLRSYFNDYVYALSLFDEVWVGSTFAREVFLRHGLANTHVVPAPIAVGTAALADQRPALPETGQPEMEFIRADAVTLRRFRRQRAKLPARALLAGEVAAARRRGGRVFLTVLNPGDQRKNIIGALLGFQKFWYASDRTDLFVVKLLVDGRQKSLWDALAHIKHRFEMAELEIDVLDCPGILCCAGHLSVAEMGWLYRATDFYLCTSFAEGQNLPILESMAAGGVPVSPVHTAMADYLTPENSIRIATVRAPMAFDLAHDYGLHGVSWHRASPEAVADGLRAARRPGLDLAPYRRAAHATVMGHYAGPAVLRRMRERLDAVQRAEAAPKRAVRA